MQNMQNELWNSNLYNLLNLDLLIQFLISNRSNYF